MTLERKILLHCPLSDENRLEEFVEQCLEDRVSIIAAVGKGSARIEDIIDEIVVGDGSDPDRFVVTTSHEEEAFDEVMNYLEFWESDQGKRVQIVRL